MCYRIEKYKFFKILKLININSYEDRGVDDNFDEISILPNKVICQRNGKIKTYFLEKDFKSAITIECFGLPKEAEINYADIQIKKNLTGIIKTNQLIDVTPYLSDFQNVKFKLKISGPKEFCIDLCLDGVRFRSQLVDFGKMLASTLLLVTYGLECNDDNFFKIIFASNHQNIYVEKKYDITLKKIHLTSWITAITNLQRPFNPLYTGTIWEVECFSDSKLVLHKFSFGPRWFKLTLFFLFLFSLILSPVIGIEIFGAHKVSGTLIFMFTVSAFFILLYRQLIIRKRAHPTQIVTIDSDARLVSLESHGRRTKWKFSDIIAVVLRVKTSTLMMHGITSSTAGIYLRHKSREFTPLLDQLFEGPISTTHVPEFEINALEHEISQRIGV